MSGNDRNEIEGGITPAAQRMWAHLQHARWMMNPGSLRDAIDTAIVGTFRQNEVPGVRPTDTLHELCGWSKGAPKACVMGKGHGGMHQSNSGVCWPIVRCDDCYGQGHHPPDGSADEDTTCRTCKGAGRV